MTAPLAAANSSPLSPSMPVSAWSQPMFRITPPPRLLHAPARPPAPAASSPSRPRPAVPPACARTASAAASPVSVSAPALLTQTSSPPQTSHALIRQMSARGADRAGRPAGPRRRPPGRRTSCGRLLRPLPASAGRERSRRRRPRASSSAMARPMPLVEPVTRARRPANSRPGDGPAGRTPSRSPSRSAMVRSQHRMHQPRRDLGQRLQYEEALMQTRMRQRQLRVVADQVAVEQQVEVDGARARRVPGAPGPGRSRPPAGLAAALPAARSVRSSATALRYGPWPGRPADRGRFVHRGNARHLDARPAAQGGQRPVEVGPAVAEVAAEGDVSRRGHALTSRRASGG